MERYLKISLQTLNTLERGWQITREQSYVRKTNSYAGVRFRAGSPVEESGIAL